MVTEISGRAGKGTEEYIFFKGKKQQNHKTISGFKRIMLCEFYNYNSEFILLHFMPFLRS